MLAIDVNNKIRMVRGDTACIEFAVNDYYLSPGDQVKFTVKTSVNAEEPSILKIITEFEDGKAIIKLEENDTKHLEAIEYLYEIEVRIGEEIVDTVITATQFKLIADL